MVQHLGLDVRWEFGVGKNSALNYLAVIVLLALVVPLPFELMARIRT